MQEEIQEVQQEIENATPIKKFVFYLSLENAEVIDDMSRDKRNELINSLLDEYVRRDYEEYKSEKTYSFIKKVLIFLLLMTIGIPLIIFLAKVSFDLTHSNYKGMQMNVERLYQNKGKYY